MSESLENMLKRQEGRSLTMYYDSRDVPTIGYGRNLRDKGISEDEATMMLESDIQDAKNDLHNTFPWTDSLDDARKLVLTNMMYNLGLTKFCGFTKMLQALSFGDYKTASDEMLNSEWHKEVGKRAEELAQIMLTGIIT